MLPHRARESVGTPGEVSQQPAHELPPSASKRNRLLGVLAKLRDGRDNAGEGLARRRKGTGAVYLSKLPHRACGGGRGRTAL
eukprot:3521813-Prymnesium_polylepis.1